jgi:hypothetical protein
MSIDLGLPVGFALFVGFATLFLKMFQSSSILRFDGIGVKVNSGELDDFLFPDDATW